MIFDLQAVIHAGHLCNLYGLDTISLGVTLGLAMELFERGLLTTADTDGLEIRYGDAGLVYRLIELTARRQGFGALLAEGNAALAERFGAPELSATVNRLEAPMHDPRAYLGMAVTYALSPRGACHMQGDVFSLDLGQTNTDGIGLSPATASITRSKKGRSSARLQAWRNLYNSLVLCQFENPGADLLLAALNRRHRLGPGSRQPADPRQAHRDGQTAAEPQAGADPGRTTGCPTCCSSRWRAGRTGASRICPPCCLAHTPNTAGMPRPAPPPRKHCET